MRVIVDGGKNMISYDFLIYKNDTVTAYRMQQYRIHIAPHANEARNESKIKN